MKKYIFITITLLMIASTGCKVNYSFTGASIAANVKTFSVEYFPNRAQLVNPTLSDFITEELKDKITRQTSLDNVNQDADLQYSGTITGYEVKPLSIQEGDVAASNRLTVTIRVSFVNNKNHENDFETNFSAYADFTSNRILSEVEDQLIEEIVDQIIEDIFNKSLANW